MYKYETIEDIFNSELFQQLCPQKPQEQDIFNIQHVSSSQVQRARRNAIGTMFPCENFAIFKPLFTELHHLINTKQKKLVPISTKDRLSQEEFKVGSYYVLKGQLVFIDDISDYIQVSDRKDRRLRLIFENGMESNMLLRSLSKRLWESENSFFVANLDNTEYNTARIKTVNEDAPLYNQPKPTGYIYIAKTTRDEFKNIPNLYKIGLTTRNINERLKDATSDSAFLYAKAEIIKTIPLQGLEILSVEQAIHDLFAECRLEIEARDDNGVIYTPKEWFIVPIEAINQALELIQNRNIHEFVYSLKLKKIIKR